MLKRKVFIVFALLLIHLPLAHSSALASYTTPSQFWAYEESYYYSHKDMESQGSGSLITYNQQAFIPITDVTDILGLKLERRGSDLYLSGEATVHSSPLISGHLSKDRMITENLRVNPAIGAGAGLVLEDDNPVPLFSKSGNQSLYPSSTMKMMTALLAIEQGNLQDIVTISSNVAKVPSDSSKAGLIPGERMTLEQLLYALLLPSGNDAAVAIAEHISGSEQKFVAAMNKRAKELGATRTNFVNTHGYHHWNQSTTVSDLAKIAKEAAKYPIFMEIIASPTYYASYQGKNGLPKFKLWKNTNASIQKDSIHFNASVVGGKTGYTRASRYNLVSFAKSNGHDYIVVLLRGEKNQRYTDTKNLLQSIVTKRTALDQAEKTRITVTPFSGKLIVNGQDLTDRTPMFTRNGVDYVSTGLLSLISPAISYVKRSDSQQVKAAFNSKLLTFDRVQPTIINGRMLVPIRTFFEEAGLELKWDSTTKMIEGRAENILITMKLDSTSATVNGKVVQLDTAPTVKNGRTLVPIRFISESTGASVDWGRGRTLYLY